MVTEIHQPGRYCADRRDEIIDHVFGEMGPGADEAFRSHLDSCEGCRQEVESLRSTIGDMKALTADDLVAASDGSGSEAAAASALLEEEWTHLRRRLRLQETLGPVSDGPAFLAEVLGGSTDEDPELRGQPAAFTGWGRRAWMPAAAAVAVTAVLSFSAGYLLKTARTDSSPAEEPRETISSPVGEPRTAAIVPPLTGAGTGNYFDNLEDFTRDTHNFLRRTRMLLMEFTNLGADSNPTFFRAAAGDLLEEARQYQAVAARMNNRKLDDLLTQITGILAAISRVDRSNQVRVVADVKDTMTLTDLLATLEILDAAVERNLEGQPNA